ATPLFNERRQLRQNFIHDEVRNPLDELSPAFFQIQHAGLIAQHHAVDLRPGATQRYSESRIARKLSALRNRQKEGRTQSVKDFAADDKHIAGPGLLTAPDRIEVDVIEIAALH